MRLAPRLAALGLALLLLTPSPGATRAANEDVDIVEAGEPTSWTFSPSFVRVPVGATVTWRNTGDRPHSVTSQDHLFDSRLLDSNKSWSYTFETAGTYRYFCVPNPWMKGTVVVTATDDPPSRSSGGGGSGGSSSSGNSSPSGGSSSGGSGTASTSGPSSTTTSPLSSP